MHARPLEVERLGLSRVKQVDNMNTVPIVFAFDHNLVFPACVCLSSLMMNAKETTFYDIFILYPASDEFERKDIDKVQEFYPNCRISTLPWMISLRRHSRYVALQLQPIIACSFRSLFRNMTRYCIRMWMLSSGVIYMIYIPL